jgi:hypothetical protein
MSRLLIVVGLFVAGIGLLWPWLGRLPGDFVIRHGNFAIYAPLATCLVVSVALSLLFWLASR